MADVAGLLGECERWFVRRGVPHLIADYGAREDIWTRPLSLLVVLYVVRGLYALDLGASVAFNLGALALVLGVLVATWAGANVARRRPAFSRPLEVGAWELGVFVVGPEIPSLLLGQWLDAAKAAAYGVAALAVVYLVTSYGLVPMLRWAKERAVALGMSLGTVLIRALPLLLVAITFLFFTAEVWQSVGRVHGVAYVLLIGLFVAIGTAFVITRLPGDVHDAGVIGSWDEIRSLVTGTPAEHLTLPTSGRPPPLALTRRQFVNVALVGLFARAIQIMAVAAATGVFLGLVGVLAIDATVVSAWTTVPADVLVSWDLGGRRVAITQELLRVAGFLATFAGLSFTVYLVTDPTYREEFHTDVASELREVFAVRAAYLTARDGVGGASGAGGANGSVHRSAHRDPGQGVS